MYTHSHVNVFFIHLIMRISNTYQTIINIKFSYHKTETTLDGIRTCCVLHLCRFPSVDRDN